MNSLTSSAFIFTVDEQTQLTVRVVNGGDALLFVAKDVASALGYADTRSAVQDNCKRAKSLKELGEAGSLPYANQALSAIDPQTKLIPESDVYRLVLRSKLPSAERFQDWVVEEVLPSIRRTGAYAPTPQTYLEALEALVASEKARIALQQDNDLLNTILDNELGYASIIRAAKHCGVPESDFDWRVLKAATQAAGLPIKKAPCPRFKDKNLYPISIFEKCYLFHDFSGLKPGAVAEQSKKLLTGHVFTVAH